MAMDHRPEAGAPVRVLLQGFGAMGRACAAAVLSRTDAQLVGVLDTDPALVGRRVEQVLGIPTTAAALPQIAHPDEVHLDDYAADVAVHTTTAFLDVAEPQLVRLLRGGMNVVSICQELVFPLPANSAAAERLDLVAQRQHRSVVAAGVNPGWILDALTVAASLGCAQVHHVRGTRIVDFSPYGPDEMAHIGAGLAEDEFRRGADGGTIGHIGLLESAALVAAALDLDVDAWDQRKEPVLAQQPCATAHISVPAGRVRGFRQVVTGFTSGRSVVELQMLGRLGTENGDEPFGDQIAITGTTSIEMTVKGDDTAHGGIATAGVATNLIGPILAAKPGLHTVLTLPLTRSHATLRLPPLRYGQESVDSLCD